MGSPLEIKFEILKRFYDVFTEAMRGKLKFGESVFFPLMETTSAKRAEIIRKSKININYEEFNKEDVKSLVKSNYLMAADSPDCYALTAKGLFEVEERLDLISTEKLLDNIQTKYFDIFNNGNKLTDKEKIVLFSLICSRSYSSKSCMKLESFGRANDILMTIFRKCSTFLKDLQLISAIPNTITQEVENYDVHLMNLMSHINELQKKTNNLYSFTKSRCYYLDLERDSNISKQHLSQLFAKIFTNFLDLDQIAQVTKFINDISNNELTKMSEHKGMDYSKPEIDLILEESLRDAILDGV